MLDAIFNWDTLWYVLLFLYVPACFALIIIVLLQKGKGTGFAGAFGMGAGSDTVFGPRASKSLPVRLTYVAAGVFMTIALLMSIIAGNVGRGNAPEAVEVAEEQAAAAAATDSALGDLGLGQGTEAGNTPVEPAPTVVTPDVAAEAPAAVVTETPAEAAPTAAPVVEEGADVPAETPPAEAPKPESTPPSP